MKILRFHILFLLSFLFIFNCYGQTFAIKRQYNADSLVSAIVGKGVSFFNATYTGDTLSAGIFSNANTSLDIKNGILLTSGAAVTALTPVRHIGANYPALDSPSINIATNSLGKAGDADLNSLLPSNLVTSDACVLEFDFISQSDSISVRYVFASEEYPLFNCAKFNDVFAFLISGPGYSQPTNIALVPGTNVPVAINSINSGVIDPFQGDIGNCPSLFTNYYVDNSKSKQISYNGMTVSLTAKAKVTPCQTYHIKLAIADVGAKPAGDDQYDSGVFLEANSFSSPGPTVTADSALLVNNQPTVVRGCRKGSFTVHRTGSSINSAGTAVLDYAGTAIPGVDYTALPTNIIFSAGQKDTTLTIDPLDNGTAGNREIIIRVKSTACVGSWNDSVSVLLKDSISFHQNFNNFICYSSNGIAVLNAPFNNTAVTNSYLWNTGATTQSITATDTVTYSVVHRYDNNCYNIDSFFIINGDPRVFLGNDTSICQTQTLTLNAGNMGSSYFWNDGSTAQTFQPKTLGINDYWVRVTGTNGCSARDTITVTINQSPIIPPIADARACIYDSVLLNAATTLYSNVSYKWNTGAITPQIYAMPNAQPYVVTLTLPNGCNYSDNITVASKRMPVADAGNDIRIVEHGTAYIHALTDVNNASYLWTPTTFLSNPNIPDPVSRPTQDIVYYLKVTSPDNCEASDSINIFIVDIPVIPNAFSPNGDGINDTWHMPALSSIPNVKVKVFDRWGREVFVSYGYRRDWDGTNNGKPLPVGVYYYIIDMNGFVPNQTGTITILK